MADEAYPNPTAMGRVGEAAFGKLNEQARLLHLPGQGEKSHLDFVLDGYGFEVKGTSRKSTAYKATPKKHEIDQKVGHADELGVKPATAIVVLDSDNEVAHVYWRPTLSTGRLSKNTGWKFMGSVEMTREEVARAMVKR